MSNENYGPSKRGSDVLIPPEQDDHTNVLVARLNETVAVAVYGSSSATDKEWKEYIRVLSSLSDRGNKMVVFSAGGGPTTIQRQELEKFTAKKDDDVRVAIVTDSRLVRGIVTAIRWVRGDTNAAFSSQNLNDAFDFLELDKETCNQVIAYGKVMGDRLGVRGSIGL